MRSLLKFGGLSGIGWVFDVSLLLGLVRTGVSPMVANAVSSATAATLVFLVARRWIFQGRSGQFPQRVLAYLLYTSVVIVIASIAVGRLVLLLDWAQTGFDLAYGQGTLAALAKIIVTPPQLLMNFVVARFVSLRPGSRNNVR